MELTEKDILLLKALKDGCLHITDLEYIKNEVWSKIQNMPYQHRFKELYKAIIKLKYG